MRLNQRQLATVFALAVSGVGMAKAQSTVDQLQPLVETSARRLAIAEQVALSKWDSKTAVEDAAREAQVIQGAVKDAESKGLAPEPVAVFFKAQIEANKIVQYALLADWRRAGKAPAHAPINLVATIRPQLDQVQTALMAELQATATIRASGTCSIDMAKAIGTYLSAHKSDATPLRAIALDRALATACTPAK
ncbi:chorismate mutase [Granulicella sp. dw_53]|uniref:chorismate mutase n=1 Tax=Granulicella sp. dw_53 TaxID=2719792 RepID=UPI001BD6B5E2|nr:chorismate mutase [Granulicella sp. dw_53]